MISERVLQHAAEDAGHDTGRVGEIFQIDPIQFNSNFNRNPFMVQHNLAGHPLFALPRLVELARTTPPEYVEYNAGNVPIGLDSRLAPHNGLSVEETVRRIEDCGSWMVIKRIERDPEYRQLLDDCLDEIQRYTEGLEPGMYERAASIFIASPDSVTPYHLDHETNFLLQIRGEKTIYTFDKSDPSILSPELIERYHRSSTLYRNLVFDETYQQKAAVFQMKPGSVIHIPATSPHWVKNAGNVSISFSAAFKTPATDRLRSVHRFNAILRGRGIRPSPVGQSAFRDAVKNHGYRSYRRIRQLLGLEAEDIVERYY